MEISGAHVQAVACRIQGGAGPGGCDAAHWHDTMMLTVNFRGTLLLLLLVDFVIPLHPTSFSCQLPYCS